MYYPCSENKGADQLRGYCEADLRLYFRLCKKPGFLMTRPMLWWKGIQINYRFLSSMKHKFIVGLCGRDGQVFMYFRLKFLVV